MSFKGIRAIHIAVAVFWLLVWELAAFLVDAGILLVSPRVTFVRLTELARTQLFWASIGMSLQRILLGFVLALTIGVLLASAASKWKTVHSFVQPLVNIMNAIPIASFVVIALLAFSSRNLPVFISVVMVMPIVFHNTMNGIRSADVGMLEMARVFRVSLWKRAYYIYFKTAMPFVLSAASVGIGIAWKSGISAELIGIVPGTIGQNLHQARVFLQTADVFAWTVTIVLLSFAMEKLFKKLFDRLSE